MDAGPGEEAEENELSDVSIIDTPPLSVNFILKNISFSQESVI